LQTNGGFNRSEACSENVLKSTMQKEVDELSETLHNLASLLLTNKTIREAQQGSTEQVL
jgi:fructose-bisphosphate aldolase class 1